MEMKFVFKEILIRGKKQLHLMEASGITIKSRLPYKYIERRDRNRVIQHKNSNVINFLTDDGRHYTLEIGGNYDEDMVEKCMDVARKAGEWLKEVLDEIRELKKSWKETRTYVI